MVMMDMIIIRKPNQTYNMNKGNNGTWIIEINEDLNGEYYNYLVTYRW